MVTTSPEAELAALAAAPPEVQVNVAADVDHILAHTGIDEPAGTWTGGACPRLGREIGSDVALADLGVMHRTGAGLTDVCWYVPEHLADLYRMLLDSAMSDAKREPPEHPPGWWQERIAVAWSYAWNANYTFLTGVVQKQAFDNGGDGLLIASFEHNSSDHGRARPHVHNLMSRQP